MEAPFLAKGSTIEKSSKASIEASLKNSYKRNQVKKSQSSHQYSNPRQTLNTITGKNNEDKPLNVRLLN
jgi:hypothetical protein